MKTLTLDNIDTLNFIKDQEGYSVIFKHNTSCPISKRTKEDFDSKLELIPDGTDIYILDLLKHRDVSDAIAETFGVEHESPQTLIIKNGACVFHQSLYKISAEDTAEAIMNN